MLHWFRIPGRKKFSCWSQVQFQSKISDISALIKDSQAEDIFPLISGTVSIQDFRYCCIGSGSSGGRHYHADWGTVSIQDFRYCCTDSGSPGRRHFPSDIRYIFNSEIPILVHLFRNPRWKTFSRWSQVQFQLRISGIGALIKYPQAEDIFRLISGPVANQDFRYCGIDLGSVGWRHFPADLRYNFISEFPIMLQCLWIARRKTFSRWTQVQFQFRISYIAVLVKDPQAEDIFPLISGIISIQNFRYCCTD